MPDHFYSLSSHLPAYYTNEGITCLVFAQNQPEINTVGIYRFYNSRNGDHYYTIDKEMAWWFQTRGYEIENDSQPVFYVLEHPVCCDTVPLHQWLIDTDHFYTTHPTGEQASWIDGHYQGILGHVFPASAPVVGSRKPLYRSFKV